jgi:cell division transport system ATP-binding protein
MLFRFERVTVEYNGIPALSNLSLDYDGKGALVLTGPTGAGKTTLLKLFYADVIPTSGELLIDGISTASMKTRTRQMLRRHLGIVQQSCRMVADYTVFENVLMPFALRGMSKADAHRQCMELLADMNISYIRNKFPRQLSGGEQHLVALARAIALHPEVIIADEPTGTLDQTTAADVAAVLLKAVADGIGVVVSTHNPEFANAFAGATNIVLSEGVAQIHHPAAGEPPTQRELSSPEEPI